MTGILIEILAILILILLNGVLAMAEISVVSARKIRLQQQAINGSLGAKSALELAQNPENFLSTVQIGITLIGILAGAFGGATLAEELADFLRGIPIPWVAASAEAISVGAVVLVITYLSLILGELAPKRVGLNNPEAMASRIAPAMRWLSKVAAPLVKLLNISSALVLRLAGIKASTEPEVTEDEIKLLIEQGAKGGVFAPEEEEMVQQVFRLADRSIVAQMTPRIEMDWLDIEDAPDIIRAKLVEARYSAYPVVHGDVDNLLGVVHARDLLSQCLAGQPLDIRAKLAQPLILPESMTILDALKNFQQSSTQIAIIIDEYGGIQGMTTITDILEAIAGDFPNALDASDPDVVAREDGSYLLDGMLNIDEFKEIFQLATLPGEAENYFQTLGGFVMTALGRIPSAGDSLAIQDIRLEVMDMDGLRVDKVLAQREENPGGPIPRE